MRLLLLSFAFVLLIRAALAEGNAQVIKKFDGTEVNIATDTVTVADKWELLWFSPRPMDITILTADGTVVTGVHGTFKGSFYLDKGGTYYFQLNSNHPEGSAPWQLVVANVANGTTLAGADFNPMLANPGDPNYAVPATILKPNTGGASTGGNVAANASVSQLTTPVPAVPTPPVTPAPPVALTDDQAKAVVLIKGDKAEGTGFMVKTPTGPVVITNIHVMANNPNLKITTSTGALVTVLAQKGAADRDLAMLSIEDKGYSYLEMAPDISSVVQTGDAVITPGNSEGGEVMLNTSGTVLGIGPKRVEISNPIYHGNSGGPVFHTKSGKVLGVVTQATKIDMTNDLDKASFANRNSAISGSMRYFALRVDTVTDWITIDPRRFMIETTFLDQFQDQSRRLDSFLNKTDHSNPDASRETSSKLYLTDEKIMRANDAYQSQGADADVAQRIQAAREMLFALQGICDTNMDQIAVKENFYGFDQERAQEELEYRRALRAELDSIGNNVDRLGNLPRSDN